MSSTRTASEMETGSERIMSEPSIRGGASVDTSPLENERTVEASVGAVPSTEEATPDVARLGGTSGSPPAMGEQGAAAPWLLRGEGRGEAAATGHRLSRDEKVTKAMWGRAEVSMAASAASSIASAGEEAVALTCASAAATAGVPGEVRRRGEAGEAQAGNTEAGTAAPVETGWPPASTAVTGARYAASTAAPPQAVAAALKDSLGASEAMSATGPATTIPYTLTVGTSEVATITPAGSVAAAAAACGPRGAHEVHRLTACGTAWRGTPEGADTISPSLARYNGTAVEKSGPSPVLSFASSAATVDDAVSAPSFFFLPHCSTVHALLAVRLHMEQQEQQQSCHRQQQQQQLQQQHREERPANEEQRHGQQQEIELPHTLKEGEKQPPQQQQEEERYGSDSESNRRGHSSIRDSRNTDVWMDDDCTENSSREPGGLHAVHRKRKEWDREDEDDPTLTDFCSLQQEAFPYPLPCCSFFELLPTDKQPSGASLHRLQQEMQQTLHRHRKGYTQQDHPQQDWQQHLNARQSREPREARERRKNGILVQLQTDTEQHRTGVLEEHQRILQQQEQHNAEQDEQQEMKSEQAQAELHKKKELFFARAFSADTEVYSELLRRHFGDQKNPTMDGAGDEDRLPASFDHEYLNFQPPPAFEVIDLRPQTFRERVATIQRDIESLSVPPPPRPCPLRFSKFISHAQRVTAALGVASPRLVAETPADVLHSTSSASAAGARVATEGILTAGLFYAPPGVVTHSSSPRGGVGSASAGAPSTVAARASHLHTIFQAAPLPADREESSSRVRAAQETVFPVDGDKSPTNMEQDKTGGNDETIIASADVCPSRSAAAVSVSPERSSFSTTALRAVAEYFGFFTGSGVRVPSVEEAVACCVAEELRGWPHFLDATTMKVLKDVLAHSKARRFNRFPCKLAWPPIPPLCTYSESNLRCSMRKLVNLKTYTLVQDYYHTRFHRQTTIHNFAVDQHAIEERKLAAAERRCLQQRGEKRSNEAQPHEAAHLSQSRQQEPLLPQQQQDRRTVEETDGKHAQWTGHHALQSSHPPLLRRQQERQEQPHEKRRAAYAENAADEAEEYVDLNSFSANVVFRKCTAALRSAHRELDFFRRVSHDEIIVSVAFYHAVRGTKLAAFDVLATQTLLDIRTAFLGCCEAESEPGIPVFPGSCFFIDGILYPDTYHASSGPEYAETIAEHLSGSGKLAKKTRIHSFRGNGEALVDHVGSTERGHSAAGGEVRIIRPRRRLDGSLRVVRSALTQRSCPSMILHEEQQQQQKSCTYVCGSITAELSENRPETSGSREGSQEVVRYEDAGLIEKKTSVSTGNVGGAEEQSVPGPSSTRVALDGACSEELEDDEEGNDWIMIPQHKAVLNNMQLPLRSLECFVHQGTCEHRVIFWNIRQFDPQRDCCYAAAYPVRIYKPSSKAVTCQACEEHLACKGVLNSVLCSVHNPTYLCERCYTVLFGSIAGRKHALKLNSLGHHGGGRTLPATPFTRVGGRGEPAARRDAVGSSAAEDGIAEEEDDDPDPFALHFDVYDG